MSALSAPVVLIPQSNHGQNSENRDNNNSDNETWSREELESDTEQDRIHDLQQERLQIHKKTFTKWINSHLTMANVRVEDLFTDLRDGEKLLQLLEIFSGKKLGKAKSGRMRFIWLDNVNRALAFLRTKVYLENVAAEDIVNGNPSLTLGLVWTIILSHTIIQDETESDSESALDMKEKARMAKDTLLH